MSTRLLEVQEEATWQSGPRQPEIHAVGGGEGESGEEFIAEWKAEKKDESIHGNRSRLRKNGAR
jgi:hypothetical protein